jgi:hypothetical protein
MSHSSDDELVLLHYGEETGPDTEAHVRACADCRERLRGLSTTLALARSPEVPEPGEGFEARVWARLQPRLALPEPAARFRLLRHTAWPRAAGLAALAAAVVVAFLLGREFPSRPQPLSPEVRERVLLVAVGDHLERSRIVLVELANAPGGEGINVSSQRAFADELVSANRLYRQTALRSGEPALAVLLEELERVLVEIAAGPDALAPAELAELQRRIESRGLLFRVQVIQSQVRDRERASVPRGAATS